MAKKTQRKAQSKAAKSRRGEHSAFVARRQDDLAKHISAPRKGPVGDLSGTRLATTIVGSGTFTSNLSRQVAPSGDATPQDQSGSRRLTPASGPGAFSFGSRGQ